MKNDRQVGSYRGFRPVGLAAALVTLSVAMFSGATACTDSFSSDCMDTRTCPRTGGSVNGGGEAGDRTGAGSDAGGAGAGVGGADGGGASALPEPCTVDADCDDGDSCTGEETCIAGECGAGVAVECPVGTKCFAEKDNQCLFEGDAPWLVYTADQETPGVVEAYALKSDLVGEMEPIKISPLLQPGWRATGLSNKWSPDGSSLVLVIEDDTGTTRAAYVVAFSDGSPGSPISLTEGMPPSSRTDVEWSPSGKTIALLRDDGFYVVDGALGGSVEHVRVSGDGLDQVRGWVKSDDELVYSGRNVVSLKSNITRVVRNGDAWDKQPLVSDLNLAAAFASDDRSLAAYYTIDAPDAQTLYVVETAAGSMPAKMAGPASVMALYPSPDATRFLLASRATDESTSNVAGGPLASAANPPLLKANVALHPYEIVGNSLTSPWAPSSARAAVFQKGVFGRQLVIHQPEAQEPWLPVAGVEQTNLNDGTPVWSPDSALVALPSRSSAASGFRVSVVTAADREAFQFDTIAAGDLPFWRASFSVSGEFFAYVKGPQGSEQGAYLDLREGVAQAGDSAPFPGQGPVSSFSFSPHGTQLLYRRGRTDAQKCLLLDLAGEAPAQAVTVNSAGSATSCAFQVLP